VKCRVIQADNLDKIQMQHCNAQSWLPQSRPRSEPTNRRTLTGASQKSATVAESRGIDGHQAGFSLFLHQVFLALVLQRDGIIFSARLLVLLQLCSD
jgi:hypothetical protein